MKRVHLFCYSLALVVLLSCGSKNPIIGEWTLSNMNVEKAITNIPKDQKEMARNLMNLIFQGLKGNMKMVFEKNGNYRIESPGKTKNSKIKTGKWSLSEDKKILYTEVDGEKDKINVVKLTDDILIIDWVFSGQEEVELTFER